MKVYFSFPTTFFSKYRDIYEKIQEQIINSGFELFGETDQTAIEQGEGLLDENDWEILYQRHLNAVRDSDLVIVDASDKSTFGIGFISAVALQSNKPLLILLRENCIGGAFISGLQHPLLERKFFTASNVQGVVDNFLKAQEKA